MIENNHVALWNSCLQIIRDNVPEPTFNTWFAPIKPLKYEGNTLTVGVPSQFFYEFIEEKFLSLLRSALYKGIGEGTQLMYSILTARTERVEMPSSTPARRDPLPTKDPRRVERIPFAPQDLDARLKSSYTFENFIKGTTNELTRSVAETVAEKPGKTAFNPLFIYGPSGVGKTHLANAIGNRIKTTMPSQRVLYLSAHLFQVQYTDSVRNNTVNDFINFYQTIDVLIIDDVQELAGQTKTQNTFFHIFNHLHQNGKQLILTSDRSPVALQGMEDRMLTRFKWGLLAELERPNTELRKNILKNKMYRDGLKLSEQVINYIAENVKESVRDLEGIVNSLLAFSVVYNKKEIDLELAERIVEKVAKVEKRTVTIESIMSEVCTHYSIDHNSIQSRSRKREIVQARQVAMYLAKKYTDASSSQIGLVIGKKDHATVLHSCKLITSQLGLDKELRTQVEEIEASLKAV